MRLSPRELQIVDMAAAGAVNKEIGLALGIQVCTIDSYWQRIFRKLDARGRSHAVAIVTRARGQL